MGKKKKDDLTKAIDDLIFEAESSIDRERSLVDIITFCEGEHYLNLLGQDPPFLLWPMQKIVLKLFYRGTRGNEHIELTQDELDLLKDIAENEELDYIEEHGGFGQVIDKYRRGHLHNTMLLVMGRRSSKTAIVSLIASYESYKLCETPEGNPHKFYKISPDKPIAILNVAVSEKQAYDPLFKEIQSRIIRSPYFSDKINFNACDKTTIYLLTDADKRENARRRKQGKDILLQGSVVLKSGHSNSGSLRGQAAICILFDEFAHMLNSSGKASADECYNALTPSTRQFGMDGKVVLLSDPKGREGMFWRLFQMSQDREEIDGNVNYLNEEILALQMPTWRMNPNPEFAKEELERTEKAKDPIAFATSWNARFQGSAGDRFFNEEKIFNCIDYTLDAATRGEPGYDYYIHLDPATREHYCSLVVCHCITLRSAIGEIRRKVVVDLVKWWRPTKDSPISLQAVEETIRELCRRFKVAQVSYDAWNSAQTIERLQLSGINAVETPYTPAFKTKIYSELRNLVHEENMVLYPCPQLIGELRYLTCKIMSRGLKLKPDLKSEFPTDDCADALAGAAYQATTHKTSKGFPRSGLVWTGRR